MLLTRCLCRRPGHALCAPTGGGKAGKGGTRSAAARTWSRPSPVPQPVARLHPHQGTRNWRTREQKSAHTQHSHDAVTRASSTATGHVYTVSSLHAGLPLTSRCSRGRPPPAASSPWCIPRHAAGLGAMDLKGTDVTPEGLTPQPSVGPPHDWSAQPGHQTLEESSPLASLADNTGDCQVAVSKGDPMVG